jgi:ClpP class serine protease
MALTQDYLEAMVSLVNREDLNPEFLRARDGVPLSNTRVTREREGVAIIPVHGPLIRRGNWIQEVSGAVSTELLAKDFNAALDNPNVREILLEIDSPGGEANGTAELAEMIFNARGRKRIVGYATGDCCSGAYWLASACEELYVSETSMVGSIGVAAVIHDTSARDERTGKKAYKFVSSNAPNKRPNLDTAEGRSVVQKTLDDLETIFISKVARNRSVTTDVVMSDFGKGGVLTGEAAVAAGMADGISTEEAVIKSLIDSRYAARSGSPSAAATEKSMATENNGGQLSIGDRIKHAFGNIGLKIVDDNSSQGQPAAGEGVPNPSAEVERLRQELAAATEREQTLRAQISQQTQSSVQMDTQHFTNSLLASGKCLPVAVPIISALLITAAEDDRKNPLKIGFEINGRTYQANSRVEAIKALCEVQAENLLTTEAGATSQIDAGQKMNAEHISSMFKLENKQDTPEARTSQSNETSSVTAERKKQLLSMTPLGKSVMGGLTNGNNGSNKN